MGCPTASTSSCSGARWRLYIFAIRYFPKLHSLRCTFNHGKPLGRKELLYGSCRQSAASKRPPATQNFDQSDKESDREKNVDEASGQMEPPAEKPENNQDYEQGPKHQQLPETCEVTKIQLLTL